MGDDIVRAFMILFQTAKIEKGEYDAELECLNEAVTSLRWERTTIKRQRKILEEDITEDLKPNQTQVKDAYAASMMERVLTGQAKMPKAKLNNQEFRKAISKYYGAKAIMDGIPKKLLLFGGLVRLQRRQSLPHRPKNLEIRRTGPPIWRW